MRGARLKAQPRPALKVREGIMSWFEYGNGADRPKREEEALTMASNPIAVFLPAAAEGLEQTPDPS